MKRQCYHSDESYWDPATGRFNLIRVVEAEAGYDVVRGYDTLAEAQEVAKVLNDHGRLSESDVLDIRVSSMAASNL